MDDLVRWLGEQFDEDARIAREAGGKYESGLRWWEDGRFGNDGTVGDERGSVVVYSTGAGRQHSAHIVRHDPARVLREIDAKRQLVERYAWLREHGDTGGTAWVLPLLALPYADRPGYRAEWAPTV